MVKGKRRRKQRRLARIKLVPVETYTEQRKKFPKGLINTFINLDKTKVKGTKFDFKYYEWTKKAYKLYEIEAKKYLGKDFEDKLESGRLIVLLTKATADLRNVKQQKSSKKKEKVRETKTEKKGA